MLPDVTNGPPGCDSGMDVNVINGMHRTQYATSFTPEEYQLSAKDPVWAG
jgi:hypothetical protein